MSALKRLSKTIVTVTLACSASVTLMVHAIAAQPLKLRHTVYLGGLYLGSVTTDIEQSDNNYLIRTDVVSSEGMSWLFKWTAKGVSQGAFDQDKLTPVLHSHLSQWKDKKRGADLSFNETGDVSASLVGKKYTDLKKYTPVDPASLKGSMDPLSMILAALSRYEETGSCSGFYPVYDGRRRYDVLLSDGGVRQFNSSSYSVFAGEAYGCRFDVVEKGGFRREKSYEIEDPSDLVVWVAAPAANARPVPVRMEVKTSFGMLELHLDKYDFGDLQLASKNSR